MRAFAITLLTLLCLAGCGNGQGQDSARPSETSSRSGGAESDADLDDLCERLSTDQVEQVTGIATEVERAEPLGGVTCTWSGGESADSEPLSVYAQPRTEDLDEQIATITEEADDVTVERVEVAGAEDAAVVDDARYGISSTVVVAVTATTSYTVHPISTGRDDERRLGLAALTVLLGGDLPADAVVDPGPPPHPCDVLDPAAVRAAGGGRVTTSRDDVEGPDGYLSQTCRYEAADESGPQVVLRSTRTVRLADVADLQERAGSDVEPVDVAGLAGVYLVTRPDRADRVEALLQRGRTQYSLVVETEDDASPDALVRALLDQIGAS